MKKLMILASALIIALSACNSGKRANSSQTGEEQTATAEGSENIAAADNSRNSLDWAGVYKGVLPCADCDGIQEEIRLNNDLSYEMVITYLGKDDNRFTDNGRFEWDEAGSRIKLISATGYFGEVNRWFQVGENRLIALDTEGNRMENNLPSEIYNFQKIDLDFVITEKYWKLVELNGKEITFAPEGQTREAYFILKNEENKVIGHTGCNNMNGSYSLTNENNGISFTPMVTTRMACVGVEYEAEYLDVFQSCDSYAVLNDTLTLKKGETPLAKFAAVYLQ